MYGWYVPGIVLYKKGIYNSETIYAMNFSISYYPALFFKLIVPAIWLIFRSSWSQTAYMHKLVIIKRNLGILSWLFDLLHNCDFVIDDFMGTFPWFFLGSSISSSGLMEPNFTTYYHIRLSSERWKVVSLWPDYVPSLNDFPIP